MLARKLIPAAVSGAVGPSPTYAEDVFASYLFVGTGSSRSIVNGIDLAAEGGMVWSKNLNNSVNASIYDSGRGVQQYITSKDSNAQATVTTGLTAFNSDGFDVGGHVGSNDGGARMVSWTFRKAPGFFDVVTYTGDGSSNRSIAHGLDSVPGMIFVKRLDSNSDWVVYHRSKGTAYAALNLTNGFASSSSRWPAAPSATDFRVGSHSSVNNNGSTFVAYLFAHDDARFGPGGDEPITAAGSYAGNSNTDGPTVNLGWEPQWLMIKRNGSSNWIVFDIARLMPTDLGYRYVSVNLANAENSSDNYYLKTTATGFQILTDEDLLNSEETDYVYFAIRRGDKRPASGSDFFQARTRTGTSAADNTSSANFRADLAL